jgi:hypothetical protein
MIDHSRAEPCRKIEVVAFGVGPPEYGRRAADGKRRRETQAAQWRSSLFRLGQRGPEDLVRKGALEGRSGG